MLNKSNLQLVAQIRTTATRLVKKMRKQSAQGFTLSLTERSVLGVLHQSAEMLPNELAAAEKITAQSMSQILSHLAELGFIHRRQSREDKRKCFISLSAKGKAMIEQVRSEKDNWLYEAIANNCTQEDITILKKAVAVLNKIVEYEND